jgi:sporadic carbohydrate cluster protein (TIGR04323 family)
MLIRSRKGWRGYIFSREVNDCIVPQRVQNAVIRNYAAQREMLFLLSATEYYMDNCYMMLEALLDELEKIEGIIFYSMWMLPQDSQRRQSLYDRVIDSGCSLHFALEELAIDRAKDIALIEETTMSFQLASEVAENWSKIEKPIAL